MLTHGWGFPNVPYHWVSHGLWEAALIHGAVESNLCISLSFHVFWVVCFFIENKVRFLSEWMANESDTKYVL